MVPRKAAWASILKIALGAPRLIFILLMVLRQQHGRLS